MDTIYVDPDKLRAFAVNVLTKTGVPVADANVTADSMVEANLRGIDSHGISRLKIYVEKILSGAIAPRAKTNVLRDDHAVVVLSGGNGLGQAVAKRAMDIAIRKAEEYGVGIVGVKDTNHIGMASYYVLEAIENNMIGIVLTNGSPNMPPWGGMKALLGTNPIAVGVPAGDEPPYVMDIATSMAARGKILLAAKEGRGIPPDWALSRDGVPTTDACEALQGLVQPMAGHKGYALALGIDIMAGVLTGANYADKIPHMYKLDSHEPQNIGNLFQAIKIDSFMDVDEFKARMDDILRKMKTCPRAPGSARIFTPGELEQECKAKRQQDGITLPIEVFKELEYLSREHGIEFSITLRG